jgi:hypothetical protein
MEFVIKKASKQAKKLRISFSSPSGGGKTYSALLTAYGICKDWSKIYLIDSERESASIYSDLGEFNVLPLSQPYSPQRYIRAIKACEDAGAEVIIIDSITHEWSGQGGCLEIQNKLGGEYKHWAQVTPLHNAFIDAILTSKAHVFCTVRRKEEYAMSQGSDGRMKIQKMGLGEQTRDGFNYEMDLVFEIDHETHTTKPSKDRTQLFTDSDAFVITVETGETLKKWAESGVTSNLDEGMNHIRKATTLVELTNVFNSFKELHGNSDFMESLSIKKKEFSGK